LPITSSRAVLLCDALARVYAALGIEQAAGGDNMFRRQPRAVLFQTVGQPYAEGEREKPGRLPPRSKSLWTW
jgi:hypothetical protein